MGGSLSSTSLGSNDILASGLQQDCPCPAYVDYLELPTGRRRINSSAPSPKGRLLACSCKGADPAWVGSDDKPHR